eukprot:CAMPEP_0184729340 /NCGR_PEP_ID=MMETSP0314-20130426/43828_1 /TAXON_ID=38298 /ORGANISM="Rhodella maculata, Strain CCMP 736" /LENGTH=131 /DNA_ID=CAMNT_0027195359 /DNA_START=14 /DNA_END=405 /DNA_ORIENTATION=+
MAENPVDVLENLDDVLDYAHHALRGARPTLEDRYVATVFRPSLTAAPTGIFAVFDGHGGEATAQFLQDELEAALTGHEHFAGDLPKALRGACAALEARVLERQRGGGGDTSGSTLTMVVIRGRRGRRGARR